MEELTQVAGKKPVASVGLPSPNLYERAQLLYRRAQIRHILDNIDFWPKKVQAKAEERLRDLSRDVRGWRQAGYASRPVIGFASLCLVAFCLLGWKLTERGPIYTFQAPTEFSRTGDEFQIIQKQPDGLHYHMRRVHIDNLQPVWKLDFATNTCEKLPWSPGETLTWFAYEDRGKCWSVAHRDLGYKFLRDSKFSVVLAPNCWWLSDDVTADCQNGIAEF